MGESEGAVEARMKKGKEQEEKMKQQEGKEGAEEGENKEPDKIPVRLRGGRAGEEGKTYGVEIKEQGRSNTETKEGGEGAQEMAGRLSVKQEGERVHGDLALVRGLGAGVSEVAGHLRQHRSLVTGGGVLEGGTSSSSASSPSVSLSSSMSHSVPLSPSMLTGYFVLGLAWLSASASWLVCRSTEVKCSIYIRWIFHCK